MQGWQDARPTISPESVRLDRVLLLLDLRASEIAAAAFRSPTTLYPPMDAYDERQLTRTREDLTFITKFVAAARIVDDATVLTEMLDWLRTLLAARGNPRAAVSAGLMALAPLISSMNRQAGQLALDAL